MRICVLKFAHSIISVVRSVNCQVNNTSLSFTSLKWNIAPVYKRYWTTIYVKIYVELYCSSTRGDCNMICWFKQEECSHLMPASLVYSKSVIECLLHCLLNIPRNIGDAFFYVITCVYTSWKTVALLFLFHVLYCNAIFANQDLLPTLRPGNFDLHTKCLDPALPEP